MVNCNQSTLALSNLNFNRCRAKDFWQQNGFDDVTDLDLAGQPMSIGHNQTYAFPLLCRNATVSPDKAQDLILANA